MNDFDYFPKPKQQSICNSHKSIVLKPNRYTKDEVTTEQFFEALSILL